MQKIEKQSIVHPVSGIEFEWNKSLITGQHTTGQAQNIFNCKKQKNK